MHCVSILKEVVYTVVQWGNRECALYSYWERRSAYCFPIGLDWKCAAFLFAKRECAVHCIPKGKRECALYCYYEKRSHTVFLLDYCWSVHNAHILGMREYVLYSTTFLLSKRECALSRLSYLQPSSPCPVGWVNFALFRISCICRLFEVFSKKST